MESFIRSPEPLKDDKSKTWSLWKEEFLIFMDLLGYSQRSQLFKANLFKNLIGSVGLGIIQSKLSFEDSSEKDNLDILLQKFDNYHFPQETEVQKRFKFFNSGMKSDETIENYIQNLKEKAKGCNFSTLADSLVRDVIVLNTSDKMLRQKYLQVENLNCSKIIEIYKNHKMYRQESKIKDSNVQTTQENKNHGTSKGASSVMSTQRNCWRCQTEHPLRQCPAWNYKCTKCNIMHHFEKCCKNHHYQPQNIVHSTSMNNLNMKDEKFGRENKMCYNIPQNMH